MGNLDSIINPGGGGGQPAPAPSAAPTPTAPSPGGPSGGSGGAPGGGGGQAIFTASAIRALGAKIASVEPMLEKVASALEGADVEADSWSSKGIIVANVYPGALDFVKNDLKSKTSQLHDMADQLKSTAATWERAEQASTVQTR